MFSSLRRLIRHCTSASGAGQGAGDSLLVAFYESTQQARVTLALASASIGRMLFTQIDY